MKKSVLFILGAAISVAVSSTAHAACGAVVINNNNQNGCCSADSNSPGCRPGMTPAPGVPTGAPPTPVQTAVNTPIIVPPRITHTATPTAMPSGVPTEVPTEIPSSVPTVPDAGFTPKVVNDVLSSAQPIAAADDARAAFKATTSLNPPVYAARAKYRMVSEKKNNVIIGNIEFAQCPGAQAIGRVSAVAPLPINVSTAFFGAGKGPGTARFSPSASEPQGDSIAAARPAAPLPPGISSAVVAASASDLISMICSNGTGSGAQANSPAFAPAGNPIQALADANEPFFNHPLMRLNVGILDLARKNSGWFVHYEHEQIGKSIAAVPLLTSGSSRPDGQTIYFEFDLRPGTTVQPISIQSLPGEKYGKRREGTSAYLWDLGEKIAKGGRRYSHTVAVVTIRGKSTPQEVVFVARPSGKSIAKSAPSYEQIRKAAVSDCG